MVAALAALMISIAVGAVAWVFARNYQGKHMIEKRLAGIAGSSSALDTTPLALTPSRSKNIPFEMINKDALVRDLYVAGFRSMKDVELQRFLRGASFVIPLVVLVFLLITGSFTLNNFMLVPMAGISLFLMADSMVSSAKKKRQKAIIRLLPQFLDLLVVCMEAGLGFSAALERVIKEMPGDEPLIREFKVMHQEFLNGLSLSQACDRLGKRCDVSELTMLLASIVQSDQMGGSLGGGLRVLAAELRDKYRQRLREKANQIPVKIILPAMLIFFSIFIMALAPFLWQLKGMLSSDELPGNASSQASK